MLEPARSVSQRFAPSNFLSLHTWLIRKEISEPLPGVEVTRDIDGPRYRMPPKQQVVLSYDHFCLIFTPT